MSEALALITEERDKFAQVCADSSIEFEREASFAMQVLSGNSFLMSTALGNKQSLKNAIINVAAIGISLNPASKLAYLVPRKGAVCLDISYMGMMHLAQQSGAIQWGQAAIVRQNDTFELNGIDKQPTHKYSPFSPDRGDIVGVYVVVKTDTGDYLTHSMPISKVDEIKERSEAWKSYTAKGTKCPWVTDYEEMAKKTCVKQAAKYWPRRDRLDNAIHHMNIEGEEGIAFEKEVTGETLPQGRLPKLTEEEAENAYNAWIETKLTCIDENGDNDNDKISAEWFKLPSNVRSAIKRHGETLKATEQLDKAANQHINEIAKS